MSCSVCLCGLRAQICCYNLCCLVMLPSSFTVAIEYGDIDEMFSNLFLVNSDNVNAVHEIDS